MRHSLRFALILLAIPALYADVTLRYKADVKFNPALPPQLTEQMMKATDSSVLEGSNLQFRNGKSCTSFLGIRMITDFTKQEVTLLDAAGQRFATIKLSEYADELAKIMPHVPDKGKAAAAAVAPHFESKITGRTETIQGIEGEEHELTMTMAKPGDSAPFMRMVMRFWVAKKSEVMRNPAMREVTGYNLFAAATTNPMAMAEKMIKQIPGAADFFENYMKEFQSGTMVMLRTEVENYMPMMAEVVKHMSGGDYDPDTPFMTMNKELVEISTAPVPDSLFQIPEGYQPAPAADILSVLAKKFPQVPAK